jgi:spermidine/putrescine transport system permease protein
MAFHINSIRNGKPQPAKRLMDPMSALSVPYQILLFVFVLLPFFFIFLYAILQPVGNSNKLVFTISNFSDYLQQDNFRTATRYSIYFALLTTVICLLLGYPMGYFMGRANPKVGKTLMAVITITMLINLLLRVLAIRSIFNMIYDWTGVKLIGTDFAIIYGMVYDFLPFMIIPIYTSVLKIDPAVYEASKDLGANPVKTFFHVTFPLSSPGVISGITMVFLPAASSFVVPDQLGGGNSRYSLIGYLIEHYFKEIKDGFYTGSAMALSLALIMLVFMLLINKLDRSTVQEKAKRRQGIFSVKGDGQETM